MTATAEPIAATENRRSEGVPTLAARGITKDFGTLRANDNVDFAINPGEIHALLGENGAGKSTLVKILYGSLQPTAGTIHWEGRPVSIPSPAAARRLGIGMVFQHFSLFDALTVAENISLALVGGGGAMPALKQKIERVSAEYGLPLNPNAIVADLSVGQRQRVEIVRCLLQEPRLIIMDEPTSVLTPQEADDLFVTLRRLASEGCSVLYISHRLEEVRSICHHATILRHGKVVAECDPQQETAARIASLMVGEEVRELKPPDPVPESAPVRIALSHVSRPPAHVFAVALKDVSLEVRAGEIVSIAGVAGNGQDELFDVLSGEARASEGTIVIDGVDCTRRGVNHRRRLNAAFVPEERLGHGAVPRFRLSENVVLTRHGTREGLVKSGVVDYGGARAIVGEVGDAFDVRKGAPDPEANALSGGNLQKFVVGREYDRKPGVFVVSQPTWGVDAGAAATIRQALIDLARSGSAVLVISQDLDEIFEISDRIAVMSHGRLSTPREAGTISREEIGLLMTGIDDGVKGAADAG
ncbi:ABC transporter ATP-binding protein [Bauldia sp.]|uniref:ABC transporter ATP-binding protein n=1 Tax=Bauldia sp. TaxID=2575872 RepID=UPI003BABE6A0